MEVKQSKIGQKVKASIQKSGRNPALLKSLIMTAIYALELLIGKGSLPSDELLTKAKKDGFSDKYLSQLLDVSEDDVRSRRTSLGVNEAWEGVHVSGTENSAYYYSTYNGIPFLSKS